MKRKLLLTTLIVLCVACLTLCACEKTPDNIAVEQVQLDKSTLSLSIGQSANLVATVTPSDATNKAVNWSSSNDAIAIVSNGTVVGIGQGTAIVSAITADGNKTVTCVVTVTDSANNNQNPPDGGNTNPPDGGNTNPPVDTTVPVQSVSLDMVTLQLDAGTTKQLNATVLPANATNKSVTWSSSNEQVAKVSQSGLVTAIGGGSVDITVTTVDGNETASCQITVVVPVENVYILVIDMPPLTVGESEQLTCKVYPENATNSAVTWSSSNEDVATVTNDGLITAVGGGTTTIRVTSLDSGKTDEEILTVYALPEGITLSHTELTLGVMEVFQLTATVYPAEANQNVRWSSSDPYVNTYISFLHVNNGQIQGNISGVITATTLDGKFSASCNVTIIKKVSSVSLDCTSASLELTTQTKQLKATISPYNAENQTLIWSSDNEQVATVSQNGLVTPVSVGTATITVTSQEGNKTATCQITVTNDSPYMLFEPYSDGSGYALVRYTGTDSHVTVPSHYNGNPVVAIGTGKKNEIDYSFDFTAAGFYNQAHVTSVTLPNTIKILEDISFARSGITNISLPDGLTFIGNAAFSYTNIETINLPNSLVTIEGRAFYNCKNLTEFVFPDSVIYTGQIFSECPNLKSVTLGKNMTFKLSETSSTYALIDDTCTSITELIVPEGIAKLPRGVFSRFQSLEKITIPYVGPSLTSTANDSFFGYIFGAYSYGGQNNDIPVTLKSVTVLGGNMLDNAFYGCTRLEEIIIGEDVKTIEMGCLCDCSVTSLTVPLVKDQIESYEDITNMFLATPKLAKLNITISTVKPVTEIGEEAFYNCSSLTSVVLTDSVTSIGPGAFYGTKLTSIIIPDSVRSIGSGAFCKCSSLKSATIGESVVSIGVSAFYNCTSLTEINFNATAMNDLSTNDIFYNAGINGAGITLNIGANVTKIPSQLFYPNSSSYTPKITHVIFTEGSVCKSIGSSAFRNCSSLTSITIPSSVTYIGSYAFLTCSQLTSVYYGGTADEWSNISISSYNDNLASATRYYYSETEPALNADGTDYEGNYWYYADGIPTIWKKEN